MGPGEEDGVVEVGCDGFGAREVGVEFEDPADGQLRGGHG